MSWKGFTKAVGRLPALIAKSTGGAHETKDEEFLALQEQFKMLDTLARKLSDDTRRFKDSLSLMLHHQAELARLFTAIYAPLGGTVSFDLRGVRFSSSKKIAFFNEYLH